MYTYQIRRILSYTRRAVDDFGMIEDGDRIAVGVSGGKDSLALLCALASLRGFYPKKFELAAITMDPGFYKIGLGDEAETREKFAALGALCEQLEVSFHLFETELAALIFEQRKEKNPCSLCARMRRGMLHDRAKELDCNKIALGHHFDDAVETFLMNLFNEGRIACFSPVTFLDRKQLTMIRPLVYAPEKDIRYFINHSDLPVLTSPCPMDKTSDRERYKKMIAQMDRENKGLKHRVMGAMQKADLDGWQPKNEIRNTNGITEITI